MPKTLTRAIRNAERALDRVTQEEVHRARLLRLVRRHTDQRLGLAWVPTVVTESRLPRSTAKRLLRELAADYELELRPESGLGRLTLSERQACPPGPGGSLLSWARLIT